MTSSTSSAAPAPTPLTSVVASVVNTSSTAVLLAVTDTSATVDTSMPKSVNAKPVPAGIVVVTALSNVTVICPPAAEPGRRATW